MTESLLFEGFNLITPKENPKLVLDLSQGIHAGSLILCDYNKGLNQQFKIVKVDYGQVIFRLRSTGKVLTIANQSQQDGAKIVEQEYSNKPSQKFRMQEISPHSGEYIIYTFCGKAVDVCECRIKNESRVFQYTFNGGDNQLWKIRGAK